MAEIEMRFGDHGSPRARPSIRGMELAKAINEVWTAIDDLESLASAMDPEDQLDEGEVADGLTNRGDRYELETAHVVISTAFDRAIRLAESAALVVELEQAIQDGEIRQDWPYAVDDLRHRVEDWKASAGDYRPGDQAVACHGCPCIEQGGSPCCFCGGDHQDEDAP